MSLSPESLKPCPFCGGENVHVQNGETRAPNHGDWRQLVWCASCGSMSGEHRHEEEAIEAWNRRSDPKPPVEGGGGEGNMASGGRVPASPVGLTDGLHYTGEVGWLIEAWNSRTGQFGAMWWGLGDDHEDGFGWTKDSLRALRFARECDAQAYINETGWTEAKPTEHRWIDPTREVSRRTNAKLNEFVSGAIKGAEYAASGNSAETFHQRLQRLGNARDYAGALALMRSPAPAESRPGTDAGPYPRSHDQPLSDGLREISTAPRDGTPILARMSQIDDESRWAHLSGRWFVVRHDGQTVSDYDMGWSVYPGLGGAPDEWFDGWLPLPAQDDRLATAWHDGFMAALGCRPWEAASDFAILVGQQYARGEALPPTMPRQVLAAEPWPPAENSAGQPSEASTAALATDEPNTSSPTPVSMEEIEEALKPVDAMFEEYMRDESADHIKINSLIEIAGPKAQAILSRLHGVSGEGMEASRDHAHTHNAAMRPSACTDQGGKT